jgi:hypothetical protein
VLDYYVFEYIHFSWSSVVCTSSGTGRGVPQFAARSVGSQSLVLAGGVFNQ